MLKIRQDQIQALEEAGRRNFEVRLMQHLRENFPLHCAALGEAGVLQIIRDGAARAQHYKLTTEDHIRLYTELMFLLGSGFDADVQLTWAGETLRDESLDEAARAALLYERATDYLNAVCGARGEFIEAALQRVRDENLELPPPSHPAQFYEYVLRRLNRVWPQKCERVGELGLRRLIKSGMDAASSYGLSDPRGQALYIGLMFMLGSGFDRDPQFAWAAEVLNDTQLSGPEAKARVLYERAMAYLARWVGAAGGAQ